MENQQIVAPTPVTSSPDNASITPMPNQPEQPKSAKPKGNLNSLTKFVLFIVIVILCIGGTYYWQHKKVNNLNTQLSSLQKQVASLNATLKKDSESSETTSTPAATSLATQYLKITQLGIELPLSSEISDLTYQAASDSSGGTAASLFSSSVLGKLYNQIDSQCPDTPEPLLEQIASATGINTTTVSTITIAGTKYYLYTQSGFCGTDEALWQPTTSQQAQITQYVSSVTAAFNAAKSISN